MAQGVYEFLTWLVLPADLRRGTTPWLVKIGIQASIVTLLTLTIVQYVRPGMYKFYNDAVEAVSKTDRELVRAIGSPVRLTWVPATIDIVSMPELDQKRANFAFRVSGSKLSGKVEGEAVKQDGEWRIEKLCFINEKDGSKVDVVLAQAEQSEPSPLWGSDPMPQSPMASQPGDNMPINNYGYEAGGYSTSGYDSTVYENSSTRTGTYGNSYDSLPSPYDSTSSRAVGSGYR